MFTNSGPSINVIIAVILSMAPQFIGKIEVKAADIQNIRHVYAEAQKRAQRIMDTGDTSDLQDLASAAGELQQYQVQLASLSPLVNQLARKLAPEMAGVGETPGDNGGGTE